MCCLVALFRGLHSSDALVVESSNVSTVFEWLSDRVVRWISPNKPAAAALTAGQVEELDVEKAASAS